MYINFINGEDNTETISSLEISNPKVIALTAKVETEQAVLLAA